MLLWHDCVSLPECRIECVFMRVSRGASSTNSSVFGRIRVCLHSCRVRGRFCSPYARHNRVDERKSCWPHPHAMRMVVSQASVHASSCVGRRPAMRPQLPASGKSVVNRPSVDLRARRVSCRAKLQFEFAGRRKYLENNRKRHHDHERTRQT